MIDLPDSVQTDADAPFSHTYSAQGLRPGLLNGPVHAALDPDGTILVLEDGNKRIQAFDLNGNAAPIFPGGAYFVPLKDQPVTRYLDFAVEFKGYMYVLSLYSGGGSDVYTLDIYQPRPAAGSGTGQPLLPIAVYLHGGAWIVGDKAEGRIYLPFFAKAGYLGFSVNYRLDGLGAFPAQLHDVKADHTDVARSFRDRLKAWVAEDTGAEEEGEMSEEELEQLRSLGYVN